VTLEKIRVQGTFMVVNVLLLLLILYTSYRFPSKYMRVTGEYVALFFFSIVHSLYLCICLYICGCVRMELMSFYYWVYYADASRIGWRWTPSRARTRSSAATPRMASMACRATRAWISPTCCRPHRYAFFI
jgi:hypothetical protein